MCWLLVSEGEFPVVDSHCNVNVDEVVQFSCPGSCLYCLVEWSRDGGESQTDEFIFN